MRIGVFLGREHGQRTGRLPDQGIAHDYDPSALLDKQGAFPGGFLIPKMHGPDAPRQQFAVLVRPSRCYIHLRRIEFRHIEVALPILLIRRRLAKMVAIGHHDVIDPAASPQLAGLLWGQRRWIDHDPMFADGEQQAVEIKLFLR